MTPRARLNDVETPAPRRHDGPCHPDRLGNGPVDTGQ